MIKIDFEFETPYGKFADALWFFDGMEVPNDTEIEAMKQQRLDNWIAVITAPPVEEILVDEVPIEEIPIEEVLAEVPAQEV